MTFPSTAIINRAWFPQASPVFAPEDQVIQGQVCDHLRRAIGISELPSYVYTYAPRQAYRPIGELKDDVWTFEHLKDTPTNFSLYLHFPFCKQICSYCNLFAVGDSEETTLDSYLDAVTVELAHYRSVFDTVNLRTVFLGGGTPSLLTPKQLERLFRTLNLYFPGFVSSCEEICIEAAPDTVTTSKFQAFKDLGVNRINLGIQSLADDELANIGRHHSNRVCRDAISILKSLSFDNLVLDLINGLLDQSRQSWLASVREVASMRPETACTYFLKVRPATGVFHSRASLCDNKELYVRYSLAREILQSAGYEQETNIRYRIPGRGGYKQKVYHWSGATILGIGAGARTYSPRLHFRNGYSARHRTAVLRQYFNNIATNGHSREDGFEFSPDEQMRRYFVLNIHNMSKLTFGAKFNADYELCFVNIRKVLVNEGLLNESADLVQLSPLGYQYRDLICWLFFSEEVARREAEYAYD